MRFHGIKALQVEAQERCRGETNPSGLKAGLGRLSSRGPFSGVQLAEDVETSWAGPGGRVAPSFVKAFELQALKSTKCSWGLLLDLVKGVGASRNAGARWATEALGRKASKGNGSLREEWLAIHLVCHAKEAGTPGSR